MADGSKMITMVFTIPGKPMGKGRPRFNPQTGRAYTPTATRDYEEAVAWRYKRIGGKLIPGKVPVRIGILAHFKVPRSWSYKKKMDALNTICLKKPDMDNIVKIVLDGLNHVAFDDDSQVILRECGKIWDKEDYVEVTVQYEPV